MNGNERIDHAAREADGRKFRPKLTFYHPNAKGTGGALQLELHPAHDDTDGSVWARVANQLTVGDPRGPSPAYPRFDWEGAVCVKLDFNDLTKMLQVFRGECETLEEGRGLCHRGVRGVAHIHLRRMTEPRPGYMLEVYRSGTPGSEDRSGRIFLRPNEALGFGLAIEGSMSVICFGIPFVVPRDATACRAAVKEQRHGGR